jgi:hypothetical protein
MRGIPGVQTANSIDSLNATNTARGEGSNHTRGLQKFSFRKRHSCRANGLVFFMVNPHFGSQFG